VPHPWDIEKISIATGYNKDYIIDGTAPRLDKKSPRISQTVDDNETIAKYETRLNSLEEEIRKLKHGLSKQEHSCEKKQAVNKG
jgi:hypothetical protein